MNISVNMIGLGYIGLPTAALIGSKINMSVIGVDVNQSICDSVNKGEVHIVEQGLDVLVKSVVDNNKLKAQTTPTVADVYIIAVPTPFNDDYTADLKYVKKACENLAPYLSNSALVILESTSPVGTTENVLSWLSDLRPDLQFPLLDGNYDESYDGVSIAYCPERILPGNAIEELQKNDRVIGGISGNCSRKAKDFYVQFVDGECIETNSRTAEMAKLTENSFRDVNIAFANELSMISDKLNINVWELIALANRHPRVNILNPGCGVGGHCIAVDPWFIVDSCPEHAKLIKEARLSNDKKPMWVANKVLEMKAQIQGDEFVSISCYGLAFKPNIDDFRESPAVIVVKEIARLMPNIEINIVEPFLLNGLPKDLSDIENVKLVNCIDARKSDVKVFLVAHDQFKPEFELVKDENSVLNVAWAS